MENFEVLSKGVSIFGGNGIAFQNWMNQANYMLAGEAPIKLMGSIYGRMRVSDLLNLVDLEQTNEGHIILDACI